MHHDVRAEVEGAAEYGRGKGIVDDQRQAVAVRQGGHALDIQHVQRGIGQRFAEDGAGSRDGWPFRFRHREPSDRRRVTSIPIFFERDGKKIEGAAVDAGRADDVIAAAGNIENGQQVRRLPRCGAQGAHAAFELGNLAFHGIDGGIGQTGIEKAFVLQIEQARNGGSGFIGEGRALRYGQDAGFAVAGRIAAVEDKGTLVPWIPRACCNPVNGERRGRCKPLCLPHGMICVCYTDFLKCSYPEKENILIFAGSTTGDVGNVL